MDSDRLDQLFPEVVENRESPEVGTVKGHRKFWGQIDIFSSLVVRMVSKVYICVKPYQSAHFKNRHFQGCQLYFNKAVEKNDSLPSRNDTPFPESSFSDYQ